MYRALFLLFIFYILTSSCSPYVPTARTTPTINIQIQPAVKYIIEQLEAKGKKRIAVALFRNQDNKGTQFSGFMADKFRLALTIDGKNSQLEIINRTSLCDLIREQKLATDALLDPKTIPNLGKMAGVEVFIIGKYAEQNQYIDLTIEIVDIESAKNLASTEVKIRRDVNVNSLLYTEINDDYICK